MASYVKRPAFSGLNIQFVNRKRTTSMVSYVKRPAFSGLTVSVINWKRVTVSPSKTEVFKNGTTIHAVTMGIPRPCLPHLCEQKISFLEQIQTTCLRTSLPASGQSCSSPALSITGQCGVMRVFRPPDICQSARWGRSYFHFRLVFILLRKLYSIMHQGPTIPSGHVRIERSSQCQYASIPSISVCDSGVELDVFQLAVHTNQKKNYVSHLTRYGHLIHVYIIILLHIMLKRKK